MKEKTTIIRERMKEPELSVKVVIGKSLTSSVLPDTKQLNYPYFGLFNII